MRPLHNRVLAIAGVGALLALLPQRAQVVAAITGAPIPGVHLAHPWRYLVLTPITGSYDYLTLLTPRRHVLLLCVLFVSYALWRAARIATARTNRRWWRVAVAEVGRLALCVVALTAFYGYGAVGPRPMARLVVDDPELVAVDFHSHTASSHDGRAGFTVAREMEWHRSAGFDVMYVTDHDSTRAAVEAAARNPARAGDGLVVFAGREVVYRDEHVVALGTVDPRPLGDEPGDTEACARLPLLIQTIPENLSRVPLPLCADGSGGVQAIELVDGDPRGLDQGARERERILALADSLDLAVVAVSNLHGWGRTAPGWSLLRIPGWRDMAPAELSARIEERIRTRGTDAVVPVVRRLAYTTSHPFGPTAAVLLPIEGITLLSRQERMAWLLWVGIAVFLAAARRRRARSASAAPLYTRPGPEVAPRTR